MSEEHLSDAMFWLAFFVAFCSIVFGPALVYEARRPYRKFLKLQRAKKRWASMIRSNT